MDFNLDLTIKHMQLAVDIVCGSEHETSKVAACIFDPNQNVVDPRYYIARTNHRPAAFVRLFNMDERIGRSSQFIHAEAACVLEYPGSVEGFDLCVTDPFCPNCAKTVIEAGVKRIFIDHKGMDKDFVKRRAGAFHMISLRMAEAAGIDVYILYRKEGRAELLKQGQDAQNIDHNDGCYLFEGNADYLTMDYDARKAYLCDVASREHMRHSNKSIIFGCVQNEHDDVFHFVTHETLTAGLTKEDISYVKPEDTEKYRFNVDPLNKFYFHLKRKGLKLIGGLIYSNRIPSSRGMVNGALSDVKHFLIDGDIADHDEMGAQAASLLQQHGLIKLEHI